VGSDLLSGTLTLPTLLYMDRNPRDNPVQLAFEGHRRRASLRRAIEEIRASDLLDEAMVTARRFAADAREALDAMPDGEPRQTLDGLVDYVLERRS
jgi:geranylgeranyl pyrophosphate synthase